MEVIKKKSASRGKCGGGANITYNICVQQHILNKFCVISYLAFDLFIFINHEWFLLISTHVDWCMSSCDFYSPWVTVIGFYTRCLMLTGVTSWELPHIYSLSTSVQWNGTFFEHSRLLLKKFWSKKCSIFYFAEFPWSF